MDNVNLLSFSLKAREICGSEYRRLNWALYCYAEDTLLRSHLKNFQCKLPPLTKSTFLIVFSPDGSQLASAHGDHSITVCDTNTGALFHCLRGHVRTPWALTWHPVRMNLLASGCLAGEVRIWDLKSGFSENINVGENCAIASLSFHPTIRLLAIAAGNSVIFWDWDCPKPIAVIRTETVHKSVRFVRFNENGSKFYTGILNDRSIRRSHRMPPPVMPGQCREMLQSRRELLQMRQDLQRRHQQLQNRYDHLVQRYRELQAQYAPYLNDEFASFDSGSTIPRVEQECFNTTNSTNHDSNLSEVQTSTFDTTAQLQNHREQLGQITEYLRRDREVDLEELIMDARVFVPLQSTQPEAFQNWPPAPLTVPNSVPFITRPYVEQAHASTSNPTMSATATTSTVSINATFEQVQQPELVTYAERGIRRLRRPRIADDLDIYDAIPIEAAAPVAVQVVAAQSDTDPPFVHQDSDVVEEDQRALSPILLERLQDAVAYARDITQSSMNAFMRRHRRSIDALQRSYSQLSQSAQRLIELFQSAYDDMARLQARICVAQGHDIQCERQNELQRHLPSRQLIAALTKMQSILFNNPAQRMSQSPVQRLTQLRYETRTMIHAYSTLFESLSSIPNEIVAYVRDGSHRLECLQSRLNHIKPCQDQSILDAQHQLRDEVQSFHVFIQRLKDSIQSDAEASDLNNQNESTNQDSDSAAASSSYQLESSTGDNDFSNTIPCCSSSFCAIAATSDLSTQNQSISYHVSGGKRKAPADINDSAPSKRSCLAGERNCFPQSSLNDSSTTNTGTEQHDSNNPTDAQSARDSDSLQSMASKTAGRQFDSLPRFISRRSPWQNRCIVNRFARMIAVADRTITSAADVVSDTTSTAVETNNNSSLIETGTVSWRRSSIFEDIPNRNNRSYGSNIDHSANNNHRNDSADDISDDDDRESSVLLHQAINRAIAGAFIGSGDVAVANNILDCTARIQCWPFDLNRLPDLSMQNENIVIYGCKLHQDSSLSFSPCGQWMAAFAEGDSNAGLWADTTLLIVSLRPWDYGKIICSRTFGPNAVSVSFSPTGLHVLVGLAARRYLRPSQNTPQTLAQVFRIWQRDDGQMCLNHVTNIPSTSFIPSGETEFQRYFSINCAHWLPNPGQGFAIGSNHGTLSMLKPQHLIEKTTAANSERATTAEGVGLSVNYNNSDRINRLEALNRIFHSQNNRL